MVMGCGIALASRMTVILAEICEIKSLEEFQWLLEQLMMKKGVISDREKRVSEV